jgi:hypothetical protein
METFLLQLFGTIDLPTYLAWFVLAFIGALAAIIIRSKTKYKQSAETPNDWSWLFMFRDNAINLVLGFLVTFIFLRFSNETLHLQPSAWLALLVGATNNELSLLFIKFGLGARKGRA